MCVSGCASARPGIASNVARVPVLTMTLLPRSLRALQSLMAASTVLLTRKRPGIDRRARAATENHQIRCYRLRLLKNMGGWRGLGALHADFPFRVTGSLLAWINLTRSAADAPSSASP